MISMKLELTAFKKMSEFLYGHIASQQLSIIHTIHLLSSDLWSRKQLVLRAGPGSPSVPGRLLHVSHLRLCSDESEEKGQDVDAR